MFVTPDYEKYSVVAEKIRAIFREYDPRMRSYSLDEALLNVTDFLAKRLGLDEPAGAPAGGGEEGVVAGAAAQVAVDDARVPGKSAHAPRSSAGGAGAPESNRCRGDSSADAETGRRRGSVSGGMRMEVEEEDEDDDGEEEGEGSGCDVRRRRNSQREGRRARLFEAARALAEEIRGRIKDTTKLTASVGIGPNFMLAKVRYRRFSRHPRARFVDVSAVSGSVD